MSVIKSKPVVGIIMGSDSDFGGDEAGKKVKYWICSVYPMNIKLLQLTGHPEQCHLILPMHIKRGIKVIIAGVGGSAHLPGIARLIQFYRLSEFLLKQNH